MKNGVEPFADTFCPQNQSKEIIHRQFQRYRLCTSASLVAMQILLLQKNGAAGQTNLTFFLLPWEDESPVGSLLWTTQRCHRSLGMTDTKPPRSARMYDLQRHKIYLEMVSDFVLENRKTMRVDGNDSYKKKIHGICNKRILCIWGLSAISFSGDVRVSHRQMSTTSTAPEMGQYPFHTDWLFT